MHRSPAGEFVLDEGSSTRLVRKEQGRRPSVRLATLCF